MTRPPHAPPPTERRAPAWALVAAVALVVAVRAAVASSRLDELELERYSANLGWALLHGVPLDPDQLPIIPHLRGSVVFGVLAVPFLWAFGPVLWAMKALAIASSAVGAGFLAAIGGRLFGTRGALWVGLLLALAPPSFQMVDVLALGSHADTLPYLAAALWLLIGSGFEPGLGARRGTALALGTVLGAGAFFSMQTWVAAPAIGVAWWLRDPRFWRRSSTLVAALAAAPWIALIPVVTKSATLVNKPLAERLLDDGLLAIPAKFGRGLFVELPLSWQFGPLGAGWATWVLGLALLAAGLHGALLLARSGLRAHADRGPRAAALAFALLHPALVVGAYAVSDFQVNLSAWEDGMGSRYFMPLAPAALVLIAALLERLAQRSRPVAALSTASLAAVGLAGLWPLFDPALGHRQPPVLATEFYSFADHLPYAAGDDLRARLELLDRLEPDWGPLRALAHRETFCPRTDLDREGLILALRQAEALPPRLKPFVFAGLGAVSAERLYDLIAARDLAGAPQTEHEALLVAQFRPFAEEALTRLDGEAERWFLRGFGRQLTLVQTAQILPALRGYGGSTDLGARIGFRLLSALPAAARRPAVEGMGFQLGLRLTRYERGPRPILAALDELPTEARDLWLQAAAWGFRMRFVEARFDPSAPLSIRACFEPDHWPAFVQGLAAGLLDRNAADAR